MKAFFVLALLTALSCTPEYITVKVPGFITASPNKAALEYLEFEFPGHALYESGDVRYFRETATETINQAGARVDTVFVTEIMPANFVKFRPL